MDKDRQEAKEKIKSMSFGERIGHYWHYYKVHFFVIIFVLIITGIYVYQKSTEVEPDLAVSIFVQDYIPAESEENAEKVLDEWLNAEKELTEESEDLLVSEVSVTIIPSLDDPEKMEKASAAYNKLDGQLAAGTAFAFIFDEETYKTLMQQSDYARIKFDEYSGEIGENGKKALGLDTDKKYYYVTRVLYSNEQENASAILKQQCAMQTYIKIEELN